MAYPVIQRVRLRWPGLVTMRLEGSAGTPAEYGAWRYQRRAAERAANSAHEQAREVLGGLSALGRDANVNESPLDMPSAMSRAREVERLIAPDKNPENLPGSVADRVRKAQRNAQRLGRQLESAGEISQPSAELLEGVRADGQELTRRLTKLLGRLPEGTPGPAERPRPQTFTVVEPGNDRLVMRVTPRPVALEVAAPAHGQVRVPVLARFFPAHTVHARQSTAVVVADHCELKSKDHYHVHRVTLSLEPLLKQGRAALQELLRDPSESGILRFQQAMKRIADPPEHRDTRASVPVQADAHTLVISSKHVQLGDRSRMSMTTHYLVDESELPIVDLLARDTGLVRAFRAAANEPQPGPATQRFLRHAVHSAGRVSDLAMLEHCTGLRDPNTSIYWLFGVDSVNRASAVSVGVDNRLSTALRVDRGALRPGTILADLGQVRKEAAQVRAPDPSTPRSVPNLARPAAPGPRRRVPTEAAPPGVAPPRLPPSPGAAPSPFRPGFRMGRAPEAPGRGGGIGSPW